MNAILRESPKNDQFENASASNPGVSPSLKRVLLMDRVTDLLVEKAKSGLYWPDLYAHAERVLETIPKFSSRAEPARRHLRNARGYSSHLEFGAAAFELRMLRSQLA